MATFVSKSPFSPEAFWLRYHKEMTMDYNDIEVILNGLKPADRFLFGVKYLYHAARSKITGKDTAGTFLETECKKQAERLRMIAVGDYQL
jgi:hypothetical protein